MGLDSFQLNQNILEGLYKNSLVILNNPEEISIVKTDTPPAFLGNNKKQISIIVYNPDVTWMTDEEFNFLTKILSACKLGIDDVAVMNLAHQKTDHKLMKEKLHNQKVILFGVAPSQINMPISFPEFKIQLFDSVHYLYASRITDLCKDSDVAKLLKTKLWASLKQLFNV